MAKRKVQWIPVSLAPVPPRKLVLVAMAPSWDGERSIDIAWHDGCAWRTRYGRMYGEVTHWQALPALPEAAR